MRKLLFLLITFLAFSFFILSFGELEKVLSTFEHSDWRFILLAMAAVTSWVIVEAYTYRKLYLLMDMQESLRHLTLLAMAANFINVVAPTGGIGGIAVFTDDAQKRGLPRGRAAAAAAWFLFLDYGAFMCVLALGILVLFRRNNLDAGEIFASTVMALIFSGLGILLYIGSRSGPRLERVLGWLTRLVNRILRPFIRRDYLREARAHEFAQEIAEGLSVLHTGQRRLLTPFLLALGGKGLQTLVLMLTFLGFGVEFSTGTVIAGFSLFYLFLIVSPTPSGVGIVETLLPLALVSLRIPWEQAVIVTLAYRGLTFWLPIALGGLAFRLLQKE
jgi:uncharacterized protein (TIRG00374 family)